MQAVRSNHMKSLRLNAGYATTQEVANALGVSESMIRKIDYGFKKPGIFLAIKMKKIYNCTLEQIFLPYYITESED